jgi:nitrite reductase/ring-hydroxylating ferredoxin subunit
MSEAANPGTTAPNGLPMLEQPAWRRDFPIDWPQDQFVARRDFTRFLVLTSLPFALVQVAVGALNWLRRGRRKPAAQAIAALADLPIGGAKTFAYPDKHDPCLLLRPDANTVVAFAQKCTHLGCAVTPDTEKNCLYCPCHKGYFAADSGRPLSGPARRPLPRILLEVHEGVVHAVGVEVSAI